MFQFDHAIIAVLDLNVAIADFQALGFNAFYGGKHADGKTHNGLIVFEDGGYLELLAPTNPNFMETMETVDLNSFLDFMARGDGWAGFAMLVDDVEFVAVGMRERELEITGPTPNSRLRPDGEKIAWRIISIDDSRTPFFIQDETPRVLRVPDDPDKINHANGVTGVAAMTVAVKKLERGVDRYRAILGVEPGPGPEMIGAETAMFTLANFTMTLAAPAAFDSPLTNYVAQRGEVPFEIGLRTTGDPGLLNLKQAHGARIELVSG